jgi:Leucine-rich repeat (LRR) protein
MDMLQHYTLLKALDFTDCKLKFEKVDRSKVNIFPFMEELTFDNYTGTSLRAIPWLWDAGSLRKFSARNSSNLESIENVGLCSNLVKLDLRNCTKLSLNEFPKYLKLPNLEYLDVSGTRIADDDDNILFRGNIRNLTYLTMNDIATIDRALVMTVLRYVTRLETLEMNGLVTYTTISPDKDINYFPNLKSLSCRDTLITTLFLESIWKNCKHLQHLDIRGCKHIAMDVLCEIFAKFPLDLLTFKAGWGLRNHSMNSLKPSLLNLERMHLSTGSTVSPDLEFIQSTKLKEFSLSFCSISPHAVERVIVMNTGLEKIQLELNFSCEPIHATILQGIKHCKNLTKLSLKGNTVVLKINDPPSYHYLN